LPWKKCLTLKKESKVSPKHARSAAEMGKFDIERRGNIIKLLKRKRKIKII